MTTTKKFYSAKYDRVFYSVMINDSDHTMMEKLLETILDKKVEIIAYPRTQIKVLNIKDKTKITDCLIKLDNEYVHLEVETGINMLSKVKNLTYFTSVYSQNTIRGDEYDTKTKFIHIDLQFNEKDKDYLIDEYYIKNERKEHYIENFKIIVVNVDRIREFWYSKNEKMINKYKYLIMLGLEKEDLDKIKQVDKTVNEFANRVIKLNESERFQMMMSREEEQRIMSNTEKQLAYEEGEYEKAISTAKNMLGINGMSLEVIAHCTELPLEEVEELQKQIEESN